MALTAVKTYEVLSSWIETSTTNDHLTVVGNYLENVFIQMYPLNHNILHKEMFDSLVEKIHAKWVDDNETVTS